MYEAAMTTAPFAISSTWHDDQRSHACNDLVKTELQGLASVVCIALGIHSAFADSRSGVENPTGCRAKS